jgi:thiamine monophosphate synthase
MPNLDDAVDAVFSENPSVFQDAIGGVLLDKLRERIGVERVAVAQSFMSDADYDSADQEEATDEDF